MASLKAKDKKKINVYANFGTIAKWEKKSVKRFNKMFWSKGF